MKPWNRLQKICAGCFYTTRIIYFYITQIYIYKYDLAKYKILAYTPLN